MAGNEQKVIELDKKRMEAMAKKDLAALHALISDGLVYTHSSARLDTKQSLIGAMELGGDGLHFGRALGREGAGSGRHRGADRLGADRRHVAGPAEQLRGALHRCLGQPGRAMADGGVAVDPHPRMSRVASFSAFDRLDRADITCP